MNFILSTEGVKSLQKKPFILTFFSIKCESTPSKKGNFTETITYILKKKTQGSLLISANSLLRKPGVLLLRKPDLIG
jgi:hypothetical protein